MSPTRTPLNLIILMTASAAQVIIQLLIQVVLAYQFGARADADALSAALAIPTLISAIISGSLGYVLIPELVTCFSNPEQRLLGWRIAGMTGLVTGAVACLATALVMASAGLITRGLYGEFPEVQQDLVQRLLMQLAWQILLSALMGWALAIHHSRHSFVLPAVGGVVGTATTLLLAATTGAWGIQWVALAINAGSLVSLFFHLLTIAHRLQFGSIPLHHGWRIAQSLLPLILGGIYLRIDPVVDRALASALDEGRVAQLHYAQRMVVALLGISTSGLSVIAFPQLASCLAAEGRAGFVEQFAQAARRLICLSMPIALGLSCYAVPVVSDLLQRGRFTAADSQVVGSLLIVYMGMFIAASWGELLARGFYTLGDTRTPTLVGAFALTLGLIAKWYSLPVWGIWGIAAATSAYTLLSVGIMAMWLVARNGRAIFGGTPRTLVQCLIAAACACGLCWIPYTLALGRTWTAAPLGAATYLLMLWLVGNEDAQDLLRWLTSKFRR